MGHNQPPTPLQTDNAMADAECNGNKGKKSNGHALSLPKRQKILKTNQNILATKSIKLRRLLDQATFSNQPKKHEKIIPNTKHCIKNVTTRTATK